MLLELVVVELVTVLRHALDDDRADELQEPLLLVRLFLRLAQLLALLPPRLLRLAPLLLLVFVFVLVRRRCDRRRGESSFGGGGSLRDNRGDIALALLRDEVRVWSGNRFGWLYFLWRFLGCGRRRGVAQFEVILRRLVLVDEETLGACALLGAGVDGLIGWC